MKRRSLKEKERESARAGLLKRMYGIKIIVSRGKELRRWWRRREAKTSDMM